MPRSISIRIRLKRPFHARLPGGGKGEKVIAAEPHGFRAERQCFQNMGAALHAAIHHHVDPVADRIDDLGQLIEGAAEPSSLAPAVIESTMPLQPISTARLASSTDMMPLRQNGPPHSRTICATSSQFIEGSSMSVK